MNLPHHTTNIHKILTKNSTRLHNTSSGCTHTKNTGHSTGVSRLYVNHNAWILFLYKSE